MGRFFLIFFVAAALPVRAIAGIAFDAHEFVSEVAGTYRVPVGGARGTTPTESINAKLLENTQITLSSERQGENGLGSTMIGVITEDSVPFHRYKYYEFFDEGTRSLDGHLVGGGFMSVPYVADTTAVTCEVSVPTYTAGAVLHYLEMNSHRSSRSDPWKTYLGRELTILNNGDGTLRLTLGSAFGKTILNLEKLK